MRSSMKIYADTIIFIRLFVSEREQIALMTDANPICVITSRQIAQK